MTASSQALNTHLPSADGRDPAHGWFARHRTQVLILFIGLILRLFTLWWFFTGHPRTYLFGHPYEMGFVANSLIHGLGYSSPFGGSTGPTAIVAPGYPTIIAAIFLIFGSYTFASAIAITVMQALMGVVTIWLMMYLAGELFDPRTAKLAGAFWAISPPLLFIPCIFWETSFSTCAFVGIPALALRVYRKPSTGAWLLLGFASAIASLINPALLPSFVLMLCWLAWETRRPALKPAILGLLTLALVYSPWPIRNAVRFHAFIPLRSTVGLELYMGNRPGATGHLDETLFPMTNRKEFALYVANGEIAYTQNQANEAWSYIRQQPAHFVDLSLRRAYRFWTGTGNADGTFVYELHALLTTVFGFIGLLLLYRGRQRWFAVLVTVPLLLFPVPYYISHAEFRYRLNIDPLLTVLAAFAITHLAARWTQRKTVQNSSLPASR